MRFLIVLMLSAFVSAQNGNEGSSLQEAKKAKNNSADENNDFQRNPSFQYSLKMDYYSHPSALLPGHEEELPPAERKQKLNPAQPSIKALQREFELIYSYDQSTRSSVSRLSQRESTVKNDVLQKNEELECNIEGFSTKTGTDLLNHILRSPVSGCLMSLLNIVPERIRSLIFQMTNMLYIAQEAQRISTSYRGEQSSDLRKIFLFLRAGHYNRFYNKTNPLNWVEGENKKQVDQASMSAVNAFTANAHFYNINDEHGTAVNEVFSLIYSLDISRYIPVFKEWLKRLSPEYLNYEEILQATNRIMAALFRGHYEYYLGEEWKDSFVSATSEDTELMEILINLALSDWMVGTSAEFIAENAGRELARFLFYKEAPIYSTVLSGIRSIFNRYDPLEEGGSIYLITAKDIIDDLEECHLFNICNLREELDSRVLSIRYDCPDVSVTLRSQNLNKEQMIHACELLVLTNQYFHEKLNTQRRPVDDDFNARLHVIVFQDNENYVKYSRFLFGNSTNNTGVFREGDPSDPENIPLVIVHEAYWIEEEPQPILNLVHEYIHYLDGRFIKYGASWDYGNNIVGWSEGLAEYINLDDNNRGAMELIRNTDNRPSLRRILKTNYRDPVDITYKWSYLVIRFLFEQHPEEIDVFKRYFRSGDYDSYSRYIDKMDRYEGEFSNWLIQTYENFELVRDFEMYDIVFRDPLSTQEGRVTLNLSTYFTGVPIEDVVFTVEVNEGSNIVSVNIDGSVLTLTPLSPGEINILVTAEYRGFTWNQSFGVIVTDECPDYICRSFFSGWRRVLLLQLQETATSTEQIIE